MARNLTAAMVTAVTNGTIMPILLAKITTGGGDIRVWTGIGDLSFDAGDGDGAQTYSGIGAFGGISAIQESQDLKASGMTLSLSGVPSAYISAALSDMEQGRPALIFMGLIDTATLAVVSDPYEIFTGITDIPEIIESGETAVINLTIENRLLNLEKKRVRRYTKEDQARDDVTDLGFDQVPALQDFEINFGASR